MKLRKAISIDEEVSNRVQEYADKNGISFSGAISVLAGQALDALKGLETFKRFSDMMEEAKKQTDFMKTTFPNEK